MGVGIHQTLRYFHNLEMNSVKSELEAFPQEKQHTVHWRNKSRSNVKLNNVKNSYSVIMFLLIITNDDLHDCFRAMI